MGFLEVYKKLNDGQKLAVDTIDGPMLVLAGPGTGKTQLLSSRVANILQLTDTLPENILCLTFTENGASNMRERLKQFIGQPAYDVHISTYHSFGAEIIRRYPEHFGNHRLQNSIDDLSKYQILAEIVESMPYDNPLKYADRYLGDLSSTISDFKRGLLTSKDLQLLAIENEQSAETLNKQLLKIFADVASMPRALDKAVTLFEQTISAIKTALPKIQKKQLTSIRPLLQYALDDLEEKLQEAQHTDKASPLTKWKNKWLEKDEKGSYILVGTQTNKKLIALADVLDSYENSLDKDGLYDFDDMILRCIGELSKNDALRYTLQEQYLYILLDEFQDTNVSQLKLVELLTNNPVSMGRPNVMAVGDDDQAIYAFQGANTSNMIDFYSMYKDTVVVNLVENYRSHQDVLHVAHNIAKQIESRIHHRFAGLSKILQAKSTVVPTKSTLERHEFVSDIEQSAWIAHKIAELLKKGVNPSEIAVIAPKHKILEPLVPFLKSQNVPITYEKREDILKVPSVRLLITTAQLTLALKDTNHQLADSLWPEVLSTPSWQLKTKDLWSISWEVDDSRGALNWTNCMLQHSSGHIQNIANFMLELARHVDNESLETMLDYMVGVVPVVADESLGEFRRAPHYEYYTNQKSELLHETLSHLSVLRANLRAFQRTKQDTLTIRDLLKYVELYRTANARMINTSPYHQNENAVQLMTVYKAKGLEFEYTFLPSCLDDVWGVTTRDNINKIGLPANIAVLRHAGTTTDERLRAFFVAITRAKHGLFLCSYAKNFSGKDTPRLRYLNETLTEKDTYISEYLPKTSQQVIKSSLAQIPLEYLEIAWQDKHVASKDEVQLRALLKDRLSSYQFSPTHLNTFTDTTYGGPDVFFLKTLLRFPAAPTPDGQFGNAIHESLEWIQQEINRGKKMPTTKQITQYFVKCMKSKKLLPDITKRLIARGEQALQVFLQKNDIVFKKGDYVEYSFKREGVFVNDAHLSGKIDRLEIDKKSKTIEIIDYKTGKSYKSWKQELSLHKYKQQLYCYKLLVENSHTFRGYSVVGARLVFVEPDDNGDVQSLIVNFDKDEEKYVRELIQVIWRKIQKLDLPDISPYAKNLSGTKKFETDLINDTV